MKLGDLVVPKRASDWIFLHQEKNFIDSSNEEDLESGFKWPVKMFGIILDNELKNLQVKVMTPLGVGYCFSWELKTFF